MQEGVLATAYASGDKFFIDPYKLLPMDRFLPQPKGATAPRGGGRGGAGLDTLGGKRNYSVVCAVHTGMLL